MNSNTSLDRESFQMFLANAFEVHKSSLDPKSLPALVEVQRFIRTDEFTVDRALHLITDVRSPYPVPAESPLLFSKQINLFTAPEVGLLPWMSDAMCRQCSVSADARPEWRSCESRMPKQTVGSSSLVFCSTPLRGVTNCTDRERL
jgi:hypothetical protein